jgi:hypothetical protein
MERRTWSWLGPVSGILFVAFLVVAVAIGEGDFGVDPEDPAEVIARRLAADSDENELAFVFFGLATFFFIWFLSHLRDRFRRVGDEGDWLVSVFWAGGILSVAVFLIQGLVQAAQFSIGDYGGDVQAAKALFALEWNSAMLLGPPVAAMMGAAAVVVLRFGVLPKWLGWVAALTFVTAIVAPWIPLFAVWVLLVSIVLLVERRGLAPKAAAATA